MTNLQKWTMLSAIGGEIVEIGDGFARGVLPLTETVMQPTRVYHAGAIATLADECASLAIEGMQEHDPAVKEKKFPYSVQISMNLLTNDPVGPLTAEARVVRRGRMTVVQTVVKTSKGETAALMTSTHLLVDLKKAGPHNAEVVHSRSSP